MWAAEAWAKMHSDTAACWERQRDAPDQAIPTDRYFEDTLAGRHCYMNWYEGNDGQLGQEDDIPWFDGPAPPLLGFDESINEVCQGSNGQDHAAACVRSGYNILSLYGSRMPYNICRNLEWMVCAAQGKVPGQGDDRVIRFAKAPNTLELSGLGQCRGWVPEDRPAGFVFGYATADIFYLEACLFSQICSNHEELFSLDVGQDFVCDFSIERFATLQQILTSPWVEPQGAKQCTRESVTHNGCQELYKQCGGQGWKGPVECCDEVSCTGDAWYKQCQP